MGTNAATTNAQMRAIHHSTSCLGVRTKLRTSESPATPLATMVRDSTCEASWEETFRWQRPHRPEEPGVRDVAVDPFSLRQFSRVDIDRPLPIPSVSVDDRRVSPARFNGASVPAGSAPSSPRVPTAGGLKAPAAPTWWDDGARPIPHSAPSSGAEELPRSKLSAGEDETEVPDSGFDVALSSTAERKASEPQRWGSDVPLIAAADAEECSATDGRGKQTKHAGKAPFTCCMFVPGLTRRVKPPTSSTATAAARSSSSGKFGNTAGTAVQLQPINPGTCSARPSTMSLAVSLERFDCGALSTPSSPRGLGLDDGDGGAASASSYFNLPLELILGCDAEDEADLPVCAAFLFDSAGIRKSVLKRRLEAGNGWEPRRPSLGKVSMDAAGRISTPQVRISLKSRSPAAMWSP